MEIPSRLFTGSGVPQVGNLVSSRERTPDVDIVDGDISQTHDETGGGSAEAPSEADEEYFSLDDDSEGSENEEDDATRESERQRVFEAAGLIVASVMEPTDPPVKKRRAPPATPERVPIASLVTSSKELPPVPTLDLTDTEFDSTCHLEDAFDRYETFKKTNGIFNNRMSISSFDTFPTSPTSPPRSPPSF